MDEKYIRLVLNKLNNIVEQGIELPLYWQYEKDGGQPSNIEEDRALVFLSHMGVVKLGHMQTIWNLPTYTSKSGTLTATTQTLKTNLPVRKILNNGIDCKELQKTCTKYGLAGNNKKTIITLRLSSDNEEAHIIMGRKKYRIDAFAKAYGTKKKIFVKAYNADGTRISVADFNEDYIKGYNHNFQQVFKQGIFAHEPLCWFMDLSIKVMRIRRTITIDEKQCEWLKYNLSEQNDD